MSQAITAVPLMADDVFLAEVLYSNDCHLQWKSRFDVSRLFDCFNPVNKNVDQLVSGKKGFNSTKTAYIQARVL
jgi:hypothetical protein